MVHSSFLVTARPKAPDNKVKQVTTLIHKVIVSQLSPETLIKVAATLKSTEVNPETLAKALVSAGSDKPALTLKGSGVGTIVSRAEGMERLADISADVDPEEWAKSDLVGAGEMASRLGVTRTSLDNWRKAHKILALRKGVRNYVYPTRQFERRTPIAGIEQVRAEFDSDDTTWDWLITANPHTGGIEPIEWLRKGAIKDVVQAAAGALDFQ